MDKSVNSAMTRQAAQNKITICDLYNEHLYPLELMIEKADTLIGILQTKYLPDSPEAIEENSLIAFQFEKSYEDIQILTEAIRDNTFNARKAINQIMEMDIKNIEPWRPKEPFTV